MGDLLGGVFELGGQAMKNQADWNRMSATNQFNAEQARYQMEFQERMRATQYQTAVQDLKAAGLNPMLAYSQGGSGNLAGAAATSVAPIPTSNILGSAHQAFRASSMNAAQIKLMDEQTKATNAETEVKRTQALANIATEAQKQQDTKTSQAVEEVNRKQLAKIAQDIETSKSQAGMYSASAAESRARVKNELQQDPWYVNYAKKFANSAQRAWEEKIQPTNNYLQKGHNVTVQGVK